MQYPPELTLKDRGEPTFLSGWADGHWKNRAQERMALVIVILVIACLAVLPLLPMLVGWYWPETHETLRYAILLDRFAAAFREGVFYPRWLPDLVGGYGYPEFVFYQPGYFLLALPLELMTANPIAAFLAALFVMMAAGGAGAYRMCRWLSGPATSLLGAVFFLITPYVYVDVAVRGDWSELLACMLVPWVVSFLLGLRHSALQGLSPPRAVLGLGVSLAAVVFSHPIVALFTALLSCGLCAGIAVMMLADGQRLPARDFIVNASLGGMLGLVLSMPYWYPVLTLGDSVFLDEAKRGYFTTTNHLVHFGQLFARGWGFGVSVPGSGDGMSFQLGLPHFVLAAAGTVAVAFGRRLHLILLAFAIYVLAIIGMLPVSAGLWSLPLLTATQFPWRLLSITAALQVLCMTGLDAPLKASGKSVLLIALALAVATALWYGKQFSAVPMFRNFDAADLGMIQARFSASLASYSGADEFLPRTAARIRELPPRGNGPMLAADPGVTIADDGSTRFHLRFVANSASDDGHVEIRQIYFPGWRARIDGKSLAPGVLASHLTPQGLMQVPVPAGRHSIEARYDGPPGWRWRAVLAWLALITVPLVSARFYRFSVKAC